MTEIKIDLQLESIKTSMAYEDMPLSKEEVEICNKVISGVVSAEKVVEDIIKQYKKQG